MLIRGKETGRLADIPVECGVGGVAAREATEGIFALLNLFLFGLCRALGAWQRPVIISPSEQAIKLKVIMRTDGFVNNNGINIHYIRMGWECSGKSTLVVIPGFDQSAEDYARCFYELTFEDVVFISLRGRGKSDAPEQGLTFEDQLSDVTAVIRHLHLHDFVLFGYSMGVPFAIASALKAHHQVKGLVLVDYPPHYPQIGSDHVEGLIELGEMAMPKYVARALAAESQRVVLSQELRAIRCPTLVIRGGADGSLLPGEIAGLYSERIPSCTMLVLEEMGHDPFEKTGGAFTKTVLEFVKTIDLPAPVA